MFSFSFLECAPPSAKCHLPFEVSKYNTSKNDDKNDVTKSTYSYNSEANQCQPSLFVQNDSETTNKSQSWANRFSSKEECESRKLETN